MSHTATLTNQSPPFLLLPAIISSILLVTMKPPTTLMVAITRAANASQAAVPGSPSLNAVLDSIRAPTMVIPEIALAPDISGVCRVGGTLLISSKPRKMASTKTVMLPTSAATVRLSSPPPLDESVSRESGH